MTLFTTTNWVTIFCKWYVRNSYLTFGLITADQEV